MEIINEQILTCFDVKKEMESMNDEELTFEQKITKDFLNKHYAFDEETYKSVKEALESKYPPHIVAVILNVLPEYEDQVKAIFAKERNKPEESEIKQILEEVAKLIH